MKRWWSAFVRGLSRIARVLDPRLIVAFYLRVLKMTGWKFYTMLISVYLLDRGLSAGASRGARLPYCKKLGYSATAFQLIDAMDNIPFCMKGLIGLLSDTVPLGGYRKKYYMVAGTALGVIGLSMMAFVPSAILSQNSWVVSIGVFLSFLQLATVELMCSSKYSEFMNANPETKTDIITFCASLYSIGYFLGHVVAGPISDHVDARVVYYICLPLALQVLVPTFGNFLLEERTPFRISFTFVNANKKMLSMALILSVFSIGLGIVTMLMREWLSVAYCFTTVACLCTAAYVTLDSLLMKCILYVFLWAVVNIQITGAVDYFMTAKASCVPDGPHFDYTFYTTYCASVGFVATIVGLCIFQSCLINCTYVQLAYVTSLLKGIVALFDYVIVTRFNVRVGISDKATYILGDAIAGQLIRIFHSMPAFILTAKLCPPGVEATAYALVDGLIYAGHNIGAQLGSFATHIAGIRTQGDTCNFDNLGALILITQVAFPLACIPFAFYFQPNVPISGPLLLQQVDTAENLGCLARTGSSRVVKSTPEESLTLHGEETCDESLPELLLSRSRLSAGVGARSNLHSEVPHKNQTVQLRSHHPYPVGTAQFCRTASPVRCSVRPDHPLQPNHLQM